MASKKSKNVPVDAQPYSSGALYSPRTPPHDSGVIDKLDPRRNHCGISICPRCGSDGRYYVASLRILCLNCDFTEQGRVRPRAEAVWS